MFGGWDKDGNRTPGQGGRGLGIGFGGGGEGRGAAMAGDDDGYGDGDGNGGLPSSYPQRPSGVGDAEFSMPSRVERGGGVRGGEQPRQPSFRTSRNGGVSGGGVASGTVRGMRSASK